MAQTFISLRAIYRPATVTDPSDFVLAALPPNPDAPVDTDTVDTWAFNEQEEKWVLDDIAPESDMTDKTLRIIRFHRPTGKIAPKSQLEEVYKCMRLHEAFFVAVAINGVVRVGTPRTVHPSITVAFALPNDDDGHAMGEEVLPIPSADVLECFRDRPDDAHLAKCVAMVTARPTLRVTRAGARREPQLVAVPVAPSPPLNKHPPADAAAKKAMLPPPMVAPAPVQRKGIAPPPPPPAGPIDVDDELVEPPDDPCNPNADGLQDDANPWAYNAITAPLKIDSLYEITYMYEGTRHVRTAKAIATDRIRFMDGNCVEAPYPPEASGTTQMTHKMISDAYNCRNRKTGIDPEDILSFIPFIDSMETREILQQRLEKKWNIESGVGCERRASIIHQLMRWATRHAKNPSDETSLDEGRDFIFELQMSFYSAKEDVPEHVLRAEMESIGKGATQIARAVAAVRTWRLSRGGGKTQKGGAKKRQDPPKDRIPGTCDKCKVKGHIARNCPQGNGAGGAHPKTY